MNMFKLKRMNAVRNWQLEGKICVLPSQQLRRQRTVYTSM